MIILDTDVLIEIYDRRSSAGQKALQRIHDSNEPFFISAITLHEIMYGFVKYAKYSEAVLNLPVLNYEKRDAALSANLEASAEKAGYKASRMDAMIAAIAINNNAKLYTNNQKDFSHFEGLMLF